MSDSANFRGIALSYVFGKVLDNIILELYHQKFSSCDVQFSFKPESFKNMCYIYGVERDVVCSTQEPCLCTFLDATKAFVRITHCNLFKLLLQRHLKAAIFRVLVNLYTNNLVRVSLCGVLCVYIVYLLATIAF